MKTGSLTNRLASDTTVLQSGDRKCRWVCVCLIVLGLHRNIDVDILAYTFVLAVVPIVAVGAGIMAEC